MTKSDTKASKVLHHNPLRENRIQVADPEIGIVTVEVVAAECQTKFKAEAWNDSRRWHGPLRHNRSEVETDTKSMQAMKDRRCTNQGFNKQMVKWGLTVPRMQYVSLVNEDGPRKEVSSIARQPHTAMILMFKTGEFGIRRMQYKADMDWANQKHKGKITVTRAEHKSHMFTSEDFIEWIDQEWRDSVRMQRNRYGRQFSDKALLLIDAGPDHLAWAKGHQIRPAEIAQATNTSLEFLPDGASAHLQTRYIISRKVISACLRS